MREGTPGHNVNSPPAVAAKTTFLPSYYFFWKWVEMINYSYSVVIDARHACIFRI